jgi:hypothetical protein
MDETVGDSGLDNETCYCTTAQRCYIFLLAPHISRIPLFRSLNSLKHYYKRHSAARHFLDWVFACFVLACRSRCEREYAVIRDLSGSTPIFLSCWTAHAFLHNTSIFIVSRSLRVLLRLRILQDVDFLNFPSLVLDIATATPALGDRRNRQRNNSIVARQLLMLQH